jgi:hypothetical protein
MFFERAAGRSEGQVARTETMGSSDAVAASPRKRKWRLQKRGLISFDPPAWSGDVSSNLL